MELPIELYQRLSEDDLVLLSPNSILSRKEEEGLIKLKPEAELLIECGHVTAQYLIKLSQYGMFEGEEIQTDQLKGVKISQVNATRAQNWSLIISQLQRVGIPCDQKTKTLLIGGDHEQIITVMLKLFDLEIERTLAKDEGAGGMMEQESVERPHHEDLHQNNEDTNPDHFEQMFGAPNAESPSKMSVMKEVKPEQPIDILYLKLETPLEEAKSTLEFVIISLCQAMSINIKQAAGLLTDHNYYLMHACVKGIKGDYAPVIAWYQLLKYSCKHLIELAVESLPMLDEENDQTSLNESQINDEDTQPLFVLLSALKCGFYSEYFAVSDWAFRVFSKISSDLNEHGYQRVFAKWYLQKPEEENGKLGGGLEATLFMLDKHSQIAESVALLLISTFRGSFELLLPEIKDNHIIDNLPKLYTLINDLLPFLHQHHQEEVVQKLLVENTLIDDLLNHASTNKFSENYLKSSCISLLAEIWTLEPSLISENPKKCKDGSSVLDTCLKVFKNTCKFASRSMKLATIGLMFKLLDQFAKSRDNQAPVIYKLLTFTMIENIHDDDIREFMLRCFTNVFSAHKTIPVSILVEPILRTLQMNERKFQPNCLDFAFFITLAGHPKLTATPLAIQIMDQFARITLNDPIWCSIAKVPLLLLADRFKADLQIQDFLLKFATLSVNSIIYLKKQPGAHPQSIGITPFSPPAMMPHSPIKAPGVSNLRNNVKKHFTSGQSEARAYQEKDLARKIKLATIVVVVERILNMRAPTDDPSKPQLNEQIRDSVLEASRKYHQMHGDYSKALMQIIEFWHSFNAKDVIEEYMRRRDEDEKPSPRTDDVHTIIRDEMSHIHEESGRLHILETHSHVRGELPPLEIGDFHIKLGASKNHINHQNFDNEEYFRILPSEDTHHSEISSTALRHLNNESHLHNNSGSQLRDNSQEGYYHNQLVPYNPSVGALTQATPNNNIPRPQKPTKLNLMAQRQIDAIKNRREEKALKQQLEEEKKRQHREKSILRAKEEVFRRRVQLGISKPSVGSAGSSERTPLTTNEGSSVSQQQSNQLMIYEPQATIRDDFGGETRATSMQNIANKNIVKEEGMRLIELDNEEEERDRDGVKIALQKYSKVFKFLFNKYALSRAQHMKVENFEYFGDKSINLAELCKMLRDHELLSSVSSNIAQNQTANPADNSGIQKVTKDQVSALMRLLNLKNFKRQDMSALNFNHFMELIPQLSYLVCQKYLSHLSLPDMILRLLQHNERVTKAKGQSTILYEDPDITSIGDQEVLKEMNRRVKENPDYILPEGYYKVSEKEQVFKYEIPQYLNFQESKRVAIEVLDGIVAEALGFHILEALVSYESRYKVKPRIKHAGLPKAGNNSDGQNSALAYMKPIEKKAFNRDLSGLKQPSSSAGLIQAQATTPQVPMLQNLQSAGLSVPLLTAKEDYLQPKLSAPLKLELLSYIKTRPPEEKNHIESVADVLEELLQAVESGKLHDKLPDRQKAGKEEIRNKAKEDKEAREKQERAIQKQREELRKERHAKLKEEIEKQKLEKIKQDEEAKAKKDETEKEEKKKQRVERTLLRHKVESKRKEIEDAKNKRLEEKELKTKEEEEKKLQEKQARTKGQKEFFKKQKEQLEQEFVKRRQEQEEAEKAKKEMEELKKQQLEKVKSRMVNFIQSNKDQQRNEQAEWQEIQQFFEDQELQYIFLKYDKSFGQLFKHYAVMDKKDAAAHSMQRINLQEFSKFGFQTKIVPKIITNEDMVLIFRALIRERTSTMTQKEMDEIGIGVNSLGIEDFKKALIRIAILGQATLGTEETLDNLLPNLHTQPDNKSAASVRAPKSIRVRGRSSGHSRASQRQNIAQRQDSQQQLETSQDPLAPQQPDQTPVAGSNKPVSVVRKTKEQKILEEMAKVKEQQTKLMNVKIDDKKFNKNFDVSLITTKTIEALIQYLGIQPNDEKRNAKVGLESFLMSKQPNAEEDEQVNEDDQPLATDNDLENQQNEELVEQDQTNDNVGATEDHEV